MNELEFLRDLRAEMVNLIERPNHQVRERAIRSHARRLRSGLATPSTVGPIDADRRSPAQLRPPQPRRVQPRLVASVGVLGTAAVLGVIFVSTTVGASTAQSQLLSQIVSSVQPSGISSASIGSPPSDFQGGPSSWVTISIPPGDQEANIADEWKSALVAGTFRDLSVAQGLPGVAGYTTPQGSTVIGAPDHPAVDAAPTQQSIQAALQQAGLRPTSVHFLAPGEGMAVMATATTNDAAKFLSAHPDPATAIFGDINRYAGTYLEVDDAQGVAFVTAYASVDGEGVGWMRPTLKTTSSNIHSEERALARQSG